MGGLLDDLKLDHPRPVVVVVGWAAARLSSEVQDTLDLLMFNVIAPASKDIHAVVVTGGTDVGVMASLGRAAARIGGCQLVGVAPKELVDVNASPEGQPVARPEPHHLLITTPGVEWGDERDYLVQIAEELAGESGIIMVAIGGNDGTYAELEMAARRRWPILLVETGYVGTSQPASDAVATALAPMSVGKAYRSGNARMARRFRSCHRSAWKALAAAQRSDLLRRVRMDDHLSIARVLRWRFSDDDVLKDAWCRYARADAAAVQNKRPTNQLAVWVAVLAFATAVLAGTKGAVSGLAVQLNLPYAIVDALETATKVMVMALPLTAVVLLGLMERIARTRPWIAQRSAAEAILGEIYRFRARADAYSEDVEGSLPADFTASRVLASTLRAIEEQSDGRAFQSSRSSVVNIAWPPNGACERVPAPDVLVGRLSGPVYDQARVQDQIGYYEGTSASQDKKAMKVAAFIFGLSAATTLALTMSWKWDFFTGVAAILVAATAAIVAWRAFQHREGIASTSLQTMVLLRHARTEWLAEPSDRRDEALADYVTEVEDTVASERSVWQRAVRKAQAAYIEQARSNGAGADD